MTKGDWELLVQDIYAKVIASYAGRSGYGKNFGPAMIMLLADKMRGADLRLTQPRCATPPRSCHSPALGPLPLWKPISASVPSIHSHLLLRRIH